jgi:hypothetical protein
MTSSFSARAAGGRTSPNADKEGTASPSLIIARTKFVDLNILGLNQLRRYEHVNCQRGVAGAAARIRRKRPRRAAREGCIDPAETLSLREREARSSRVGQKGARLDSHRSARRLARVRSRPIRTFRGGGRAPPDPRINFAPSALRASRPAGCTSGLDRAWSTGPRPAAGSAASRAGSVAVMTEPASRARVLLSTGPTSRFRIRKFPLSCDLNQPVAANEQRHLH